MNVLGDSWLNGDVHIATQTGKQLIVNGNANFNGSATFQNDATISNGSNLNMNGGTVKASYISGNGSTNATSPIEFLSPVIHDFTVVNNADVQVGTTLKVIGTSTLQNNVTLSSGKTLHVDRVIASASTTGITIDDDVATTGIISTDTLGSNVANSVTIVDNVKIGSSQCGT